MLRIVSTLPLYSSAKQFARQFVVLYGSGMKDGNGYKQENLPILVAGKRNGIINPGRHLHLPNRHHRQICISPCSRNSASKSTPSTARVRGRLTDLCRLDDATGFLVRST